MESVQTIKSGNQITTKTVMQNVRQNNIRQYSETDQSIEKVYKFCLRCGKKLKNPIARKIGYGPVCEKRMKIEKEKVRKLF